MDKASIEKEVLENYPVYIKKLLSLEDVLSTGLVWYRENHPEFFKGDDFRPGTLGRFMSSSLAVRFSFDRTADFIRQQDWDKIFIEKYVPELVKPSGYLGHIKDIDLMSRFYLFHSFYHQLETTVRIIHAELKIGNGKPFEKVNNRLKIFPPDFILCVDGLRNTIHNNGYYRPLDFQPQTIIYKTDSLDIKFTKEERTSVSTDETIYLIRDLIKYTEQMLKHDEVKNLPLTKDRN